MYVYTYMDDLLYLGGIQPQRKRPTALYLHGRGPLAFSVVAEYQPEEIGTSENGARGSRTGITPLQKATSGKKETEKRFLALSKA